MNKDVPLLSVIVPAYNAADFITDAIGCIKEQDYPNIEIIVVDDGSTDRTREVVARNGGIQYVHQENQGAAGARNHGLRLARGSFISFLDADDVWTPSALQLLTQHLHHNPRTSVALGRVQYTHLITDNTGKRRMEAFGDPCISLSLDAGVFRRQIFKRVGVFDASLPSSEDIDWFMRAREAGALIDVLDAAVLFYRRHGRNLTQDRDASHRDLAYALKQSLDRRRRSCAADSLPSLTTQKSEATSQLR
ncbi:MAG: glycosyltransferase family A protein [Candidatus Acidiferrales bacterium]|jgi:glycosyltransferase involved in cell wall biosynthesis